MAQPEAQPQPDEVPAEAVAAPANGTETVVEEAAPEASAPVAEAEAVASEAAMPEAAAAEGAESAAEDAAPAAEAEAMPSDGAESAADEAAPAAVAEEALAAEPAPAAEATAAGGAESAADEAAPAAEAEAMPSDGQETPTDEAVAEDVAVEAEAIPADEGESPADEAAAENAVAAVAAEATTTEPAASAAAPAAEAEAMPSDGEETPTDAAVAEDVAAEAEAIPADEGESPADEAVAETAAATDVAAMDEDKPTEEKVAPAAEAVPAQPATPFSRGQVVDGTVLTTAPTEVRMDLGDDHVGVIPGRELERMPREQIEQLQPGAVIPVYVINPQDHEGNIRLSVTHAQEELDWRKAEACQKSQEVFESMIAGYNKGGLIVRFGRVRGFVPQSQIGGARRSASGATPEERWSGMVNQPISVKVIEVDRSRNRLILSERAAAREQREARKVDLISELRVGEVRQGRVVSLVDFGAFVDIGGAEGLVHLTEISWQHVTHPRDALKLGAEVRVEVISVDPQRKRIGLSIRRQAADPWDTVAIDYKVGQLVQGLITKMTNFGAFARLVAAPEIEGLIHISELAEQRVTHPREIVSEGETLTLRVVKMDVAARRLGLSLKAVNSAEYLDQDWLS